MKPSIFSFSQIHLKWSKAILVPWTKTWFRNFHGLSSWSPAMPIVAILWWPVSLHRPPSIRLQSQVICFNRSHYWTRGAKYTLHTLASKFRMQYWMPRDVFTELVAGEATAHTFYWKMITHKTHSRTWPIYLVLRCWELKFYCVIYICRFRVACFMAWNFISTIEWHSLLLNFCFSIFANW